MAKKTSDVKNTKQTLEKTKLKKAVKRKTDEKIMEEKIKIAVEAKRQIRGEDILIIAQAAMAACGANRAYKSLKKLGTGDEIARLADTYVKQQVAMSNLFLSNMRELGLTALVGRFVKIEKNDEEEEENTKALLALINQ